MDFIGGLPPEREKYMSKKLKKQSVYSVADVNKAGNVVKIYVDSVLFGAELVKYTEE